MQRSRSVLSCIVLVLFGRRSGIRPSIHERNRRRSRRLRSSRCEVRRFFQSSQERYLRTRAVQPTEPAKRRISRTVYDGPVQPRLELRLRRQVIRDRLVVGIRDTALSAKMQMDSTLTLETAKKSIRQREALHDQQQALKGASERAPSNLETILPQPNLIDRRNRREQRSSRDFGRYRSTPATKGRGKQCSRCGSMARQACQNYNTTSQLGITSYCNIGKRRHITPCNIAASGRDVILRLVIFQHREETSYYAL